VLPDEILLEIFSIYMNEATRTEEWHTLVHVCRRWRNVVFASPRRLDLRLLCTTRTPVREKLDVWPALPIALTGSIDTESLLWSADNFTAALEYKDRMCRIDLLRIPNSHLELIAAAMAEPCPALQELSLETIHEMPPVLPDAFLGGSAPHLRTLRLTGVPFPALGRLLSSATHLVYLSIWDVPHSGYISPEVMVTALAALKNLGEFYLGFRSPLSRPDRANRHPHPLKRVVLPALSTLIFRGDSEYVEVLVSRIDAPLLNKVETTFFNQLIFVNPELAQFFRRTNELKAPYRADVSFHGDSVRVRLYSKGQAIDRGVFGVVVECRVSDWQLSSVAQVCSSSLLSLSTLEQLFIYDGLSSTHWQEDMDTAQWLELLHPFSSVKDVYLSKRLALQVMHVLRELDGTGTTQVLPELKNLSIEGFRWQRLSQVHIFSQFVIARQLSGHPVVVRQWLDVG
jgi:F-box-like